jgi:hypothetical protein
MDNIVSKEIIGLIFVDNTSKERVVVTGLVDFGLIGDIIPHSNSTKNWAKNHDKSFLEIHFMEIHGSIRRSQPLVKFLKDHTLLKQRFDVSNWGG